jgi:4-amino-4-deoxy-L-arabinose transferase-like glycosyltransferase
MDGPRHAMWAMTGLAVLTGIRLWVAAVAPLAPDEAYYWTWSHALAAGYFDHPPMVALWIRAGTMLAGEGALGVRLLGPFSAAAGSLFLYDAAERLFPGRRAGVTAAVLLNATLMFGAGAVVMTPDTPLLLFWTATLWTAARIATGGAPVWWLAAGAFSGLALTSKYTAAFLPIGLGLYIVMVSPGWWRRREPWVGAAMGALLFLPVVIWNAENGWAGFLRQGGRVSDWRPERAAGFLGELAAGQIGLATPGVCLMFAAGIVMATRMAARTREPAWSLLAVLSVPPALVFLQHAFGDRVQGNWPAILYPAAAIAASGLTGRLWRRLAWPSAGLGFALTGLIYAHVLLAWPFVAGDPVARQLSGWDDLALRAEAARQAAGADFVAAEPYGIAAELAWHLPATAQLVATGPHWTLTTLPRPFAAGSGILIIPERYGAPDAAAWPNATRLPDVARMADRAIIENYAVFLVRGASVASPMVELPHR